MFKVTNLKDKLPNNSTISASDCGGLKRPKVKLSLCCMIFSGGLGKARNLSFVFWKIATLQPRESVLQGSGAHKATSTAPNLKVTLIE